jgi:PIN domain nuclease of toxin-antitoxin system
MQYLLDTVTIIRHFSQSGRIGTKAAEILNNTAANDIFYISVVSLMEILYLSEKNRISISLSETFEAINNSTLYFTVNLTSEIVQAAENISFYELHDRMILATTQWLGTPIISSDLRFAEIDDIDLIWE